jgi:hypothetical protein
VSSVTSRVFPKFMLAFGEILIFALFTAVVPLAKVNIRS